MSRNPTLGFGSALCSVVLRGRCCLAHLGVAGHTVVSAGRFRVQGVRGQGSVPAQAFLGGGYMFLPQLCWVKTTLVGHPNWDVSDWCMWTNW